MKICKVPGCHNKLLAIGLCNTHYSRKRRGVPLDLPVNWKKGKGSKVGNYLISMKNGENLLEHRRVAEKALGRKLKRQEQVHHVDGNHINNNPSNLVICPSAAYHALLHRRQRALETCGNANWRKCQYCGKYDAPNLMYVCGPTARHNSCARFYNAKRKQRLNDETSNRE